MISLRLSELKAGMMLAKPVFNLQGVLLLDEGTELSEKNIWILKSWGVTQVWVEGECEAEKNRVVELESDVKEFIEKELKEKFCEVLEDQVMGEIMRAASKLLQKRFLKKEQQNESH